MLFYPYHSRSSYQLSDISKSALGMMECRKSANCCYSLLITLGVLITCPVNSYSPFNSLQKTRPWFKTALQCCQSTAGKHLLIFLHISYHLYPRAHIILVFILQYNNKKLQKINSMAFQFVCSSLKVIFLGFFKKCIRKRVGIMVGGTKLYCSIQGRLKFAFLCSEK